MISLELHEKLMKKWAKVGRGLYQKPSRRHRLEYFLKFVHHFKGKDVLECGCNAGLYGYEISQVAKSYIGVDRGDYYIDQAKITQKYMDNKNVKFICGNVKDFIKLDLAGKAPKYNAFFSSFALYHFRKKETDRITETVLPKCDVVIISTRTAKRTPFKQYNPHHFEKPKNVVKYLKDFKCEIFWHDTKKFAIIVGVKNENKGSGKGNTKSVGRSTKRQSTSRVKKVGADERLSKRNVKRKNTNAKGND